MKTILSCAICLLFLSQTFAQTSYSGFVDKSPIELVTYISSDDAVRAMYVYTNFDEPINIDGEIKKGTLSLFEKNADGKSNKATLKFSNFDQNNTDIEGTWKDLKTNKELKITLHKNFGIDYEENSEWTNRELIQAASVKNHYFKVVTSKAKGEMTTRVNAVKVYEKKTDKLVQSIPVDCEFMHLDCISSDDYNFDGVKDFSIFESSYSGANTSSLYFLYDNAKKNYFDSEFKGVSLEFDAKNKLITERNQAVAGSVVYLATYKLVNNKMVLTKEKCLVWNEKKQDFVERKLKDCK